MTTTIKSSPPALTVLCFDFGLRKVGVAVGQTITKTASPVGIVRVQDGELSSPDLTKLLQTWRPNALIVGIPFNMDGSRSPLCERAEAFAQSLEIRSGLPVYRVDERLTTRSARYELTEIHERTATKTKTQRLDAFAACLITETWLQDFDPAQILG